MVPGISDTSPDAQRLLDEIHRAMPAWQKWRFVDGLYRFGRSLHAGGVLMRRPGSTTSQIRDDWIATQLGNAPAIPNGLSEAPGMVPPVELRGAVKHVVDVLDRLEILYAIGGSIASSIHGVYRSTVNVDIDVEPFPGKDVAFVGSFGPDYYISLGAVRQAMDARDAFNIIQTTTGMKVDVFINKRRPFDQARMSRRQSFTDPDFPDRPIFVVSPEDIVLIKLEWFRLGNEVSERQWSDVKNVLRIQAGRLDDGYLDTWAAELGVADLLAKARGESAP